LRNQDFWNTWSESKHILDELSKSKYQFSVKEVNVDLPCDRVVVNGCNV